MKIAPLLIVVASAGALAYLVMRLRAANDHPEPLPAPGYATT